jgi:hypothetical protein
MRQLSIEHREALSKALKNSKKSKKQLKRLHKFLRTKSQRERMKKQMTGTKHTEETKAKISQNNPFKGKCKQEAANFKGEFSKHMGYVVKYCPEHKNAIGKYMLFHRLVVEQQIGRYLLLTEVVHHVNKIVDDNRVQNLMAFKNRGSHTKFLMEGCYEAVCTVTRALTF